MKIAIFGLGYVGTVSAACLAERETSVIGVDVNPDKVSRLNEGQSPIIEPGLDSLVRNAIQSGLLSATTDWGRAVAETDLAWLCVSTPSQADGNVDTQYLERVCQQIGSALAERQGYYVVVVRSTALPGTTDEILIPLLEKSSGLRAGAAFGVCYHPEFLREGKAVDDFRRPSKIVVGALDDRSAEPLDELYRSFDSPYIRTSIRTAEMVKYTDNYWHALKVGFANEIGTISRSLGLDGREVMRIFCQDTKLNLSDVYLRPAFAFGGSCLPKDVRALVYRTRRLSLDLPILNAVLPSNESHVERAFRIVTDSGHRRVGLLGLSFKPGTDDLRESSLVAMAERLIGKGYDLRIYDHNVSLSRLMGRNRQYIEDHIPHIASLMVDDVSELIGHARTIIIGNDDAHYLEALELVSDGQVIVDLVGLGGQNAYGRGYFGICW
ncbi:MAG TPA: nucleotide sugar dehydrogenase [Gemmatimonadota bacterium]|nr:nucleotide sugar dehydrogenase [Gemmatimonadota bacterium]